MKLHEVPWKHLELIKMILRGSLPTVHSTKLIFDLWQKGFQEIYWRHSSDSEIRWTKCFGKFLRFAGFLPQLEKIANSTFFFLIMIM